MFSYILRNSEQSNTSIKEQEIRTQRQERRQASSSHVTAAHDGVYHGHDANVLSYMIWNRRNPRRTRGFSCSENQAALGRSMQVDYITPPRDYITLLLHSDWPFYNKRKVKRMRNWSNFSTAEEERRRFTSDAVTEPRERLEGRKIKNSTTSKKTRAPPADVTAAETAPAKMAATLAVSQIR